MKLPAIRALLFVVGLALIGAGALPGNPHAVLAGPAMLVTETSTAEPPTPTNTPLPPTNTPLPAPTNTPTSISTPGPGPDATPTNTPAPPEPPDSGRPDPTATPVPTASPTLTPAPSDVADPAITKTVDRSTVQVGDQVTFTLTVTNLGNSTASDVVVRDTLPDFLSLTGISTSRGDYSVDGQTVTVYIGDLAPQEVVTIRLTATVTATANPPDNINTATVVSSSPTDDPNNNSSSVAIDVVQPAPTPAPPVTLPVTSTPNSGAPWLIGLGLLLIAASLLFRQRRA
jgi:uncharacterized repeat protein (TIGR01451 family)